MNRADHPLFGSLLVIAAGFLLAGMDGLGKYLMTDLPPAQVVWARYLFHTLIVAAVFGFRHHRQFIRPKAPALQMLRGLLLLIVTLGMYIAIREIPLADATAILFFAPVLVSLLAGWLLKEQVKPHHWLAVALGLLGVLLVVRPGFVGLQPAMLLPFGSAVALSFYFILTRMLKHRDSELTTLFHTTATGSIVLSILLPTIWVSPTMDQWPLLLLMGALGATGHLMLIRAFHLAPAATLSPFLNAQLFAAAIYSVWWFGDPLSPVMLIGCALIIGAGLLVWLADTRSRFGRTRQN